MLRLFHSIFGATSERGRYSEELVQAAIERAVAITDARLSALSGYQKKLRPAVIRAIDHVVDLVDALPPPIDVPTAGYARARAARRAGRLPSAARCARATCAPTRAPQRT